eukprot:5017686-Pleurochrysis_carterae.AAC.1
MGHHLMDGSRTTCKFSTAKFRLLKLIPVFASHCNPVARNTKSRKGGRPTCDTAMRSLRRRYHVATRRSASDHLLSRCASSPSSSLAGI